MADPIFGSKYGPQNGFQNWITFSFLLLGLCLGPVLGSRFGPKSGASHRKILLLPRTSMSVSVNTCFFFLCVPICFLYSTSLAEAVRKACAGLRIVVHLEPTGDHQANGAAEAMVHVLRTKANLLVQQIEEATGCTKPIFGSSPSECCAQQLVAQSLSCEQGDNWIRAINRPSLLRQTCSFWRDTSKLT